MYEKDLAQLRERSPSRRDRIGAPASVEQIRALDQASKREFGIALPEAYVEFLRVCNGFRVNDSRILGADAETLPVFIVTLKFATFFLSVFELRDDFLTI